MSKQFQCQYLKGMNTLKDPFFKRKPGRKEVIPVQTLSQQHRGRGRAYPELGGSIPLKLLAPHLWSIGVLECWNEVQQKLLKLK